MGVRKPLLKALLFRQEWTLRLAWPHNKGDEEAEWEAQEKCFKDVRYGAVLPQFLPSVITSRILKLSQI